MVSNNWIKQYLMEANLVLYFIVHIEILEISSAQKSSSRSPLPNGLRRIWPRRLILYQVNWPVI